MKERRTRSQEKRKNKRRKETGEDGKGEGREVVSALNVREVVSVAYAWFIGRENFTRHNLPSR